MTVQGTGVSALTALMRAERLREADFSWLLFGPTEEPAELAEASEPLPAEWKYAAE